MDLAESLRQANGDAQDASQIERLPLASLKDPTQLPFAPASQTVARGCRIHTPSGNIWHLAIHARLAVLHVTGRRSNHSRRQIDEGAKAPPPFKGILSTNWLLMRVITEGEGVEQQRASRNGNIVRFAANRQGKVQTGPFVNFDCHHI
jgi:hypothetical protein